MKAIALLLIIFLQSAILHAQGQQTGFAKEQKIDSLVKEIEKVNEVHYRSVGFGGIMSNQYIAFLKLSEITSTSQLLSLTDDTNNVIACYAGWALINRHSLNVLNVFEKFMNHDRTVVTFNGCLIGNDLVSSEFYHRYWNNVPDSLQQGDNILFSMDSVILYKENAYWLLTLRAFENRVYPKSFDKQITHLAFEKLNKDAIFYLAKWYKADYRDQIKNTLLKYMEATDFKNVGADEYYEVVEELLGFNDINIRNAVIKKLKKDTSWQNEPELFNFLFLKHDIVNDIE